MDGENVTMLDYKHGVDLDVNKSFALKGNEQDCDKNLGSPSELRHCKQLADKDSGYECTLSTTVVQTVPSEASHCNYTHAFFLMDDNPPLGDTLGQQYTLETIHPGDYKHDKQSIVQPNVEESKNKAGNSDDVSCYNKRNEPECLLPQTKMDIDGNVTANQAADSSSCLKDIAFSDITAEKWSTASISKHCENDSRIKNADSGNLEDNILRLAPRGDPPSTARASEVATDDCGSAGVSIHSLSGTSTSAVGASDFTLVDSDSPNIDPEPSAAADESAIVCSESEVTGSASLSTMSHSARIDSIAIPAVPQSSSTVSLSTQVNSANRNTTAASSQLQSFYHVKWINYCQMRRPIIMQNENGPCPLLAIMNVLLLQNRVKLPIETDLISTSQIMSYLGECIFEDTVKNVTAELRANFEQNMDDAISVLHSLQTGLDVNVRFTGVRDFEFTREMVIFDLLNIPLYHGWLVDPQHSPEYLVAIGNCSYNQLVEKIVGYKSSNDTTSNTESIMAEAFLNSSASQLTYHGLCELANTVKDHELAVFFRNNHFSTIHKHKGELFLLVTDQGFLEEPDVVWESLSNVEGDGHFVDADFRTYCKPQIPPNVSMGNISPEIQINNDYQLALSLQQEQTTAHCDTGSNTQAIGSVSSTSNVSQTPQSLYQHQQTQSDHELALKLQAESYREAELMLQQNQSRNNKEKDVVPSHKQNKNSSCSIL